MKTLQADMSLFDTAVVGDVERNRPLAPLTRYRLGGSADWFVRPQSVGQLSATIARCRESGLALRVLGGGANVLVDDEGVDGAVVRLDAPCFGGVAWMPDDRADDRTEPGPRRDGPVLVRAGGGVDMGRLTLDAVRRGLTGLECMAGIPGSLGGIVKMNAGGRWGEIADVVREVSVVEASGAVRTLGRDQIGFGYRRSGLGGAVVCEVTLNLTPDDPRRVRERYDEIWAIKKASQPLGVHSAGCVFKNPPGDSAGRLIDAAGLKGRTCGTAEVSPEHANFIVARAGGRTRDVREMIGLVRQTVADRFGVDLELEIEVWCRPPAGGR